MALVATRDGTCMYVALNEDLKSGPRRRKRRRGGQVALLQLLGLQYNRTFKTGYKTFYLRGLVDSHSGGRISFIARFIFIVSR